MRLSFVPPSCRPSGSWKGQNGEEGRIGLPSSASPRGQKAIPPQKNAYWSGTRRASFARMGNLPPDAGERKRSRIKQGGFRPSRPFPSLMPPPDKLLGPLLDGIGSAGGMRIGCGSHGHGVRAAYTGHASRACSRSILS